MNRPRHHDPETLTAATIAATVMAGCTCSPAVELAEEITGIYHAYVEHDSWCALLQRRAAPWN